MVDYPDLSNLTNTSGIEGILTLPNASFVWFWTLILGGIFIVLTLSMYFREKSLTGRGNLLASSAVSALACVMLATFGSLIGLFTPTTLVPIVVFAILIIVVWIISGK